MSGKAFLDTNILVYSFDETAPVKRKIADELIHAGLRDASAVISYQVVQEFLNLATRKFVHLMSAADATRYVASTLEPLWKVWPRKELFDSALVIQERYHYSFYDALIIAAALEAGCDTLYSEDLQHGQRIESLTIRNPFLKRTKLRA